LNHALADLSIVGNVIRSIEHPEQSKTSLALAGKLPEGKSRKRYSHPKRRRNSLTKIFGKVDKTGSDPSCPHTEVDFCYSFAICKKCRQVWDLIFCENKAWMVTPANYHPSDSEYGKNE
jgi:hypothetical protein